MGAVRVKDDKLQVHVGDALELLKKYMTEALCKRVYQEYRTDERERVWTLYPLMWFWVMVSAQGVPAMREAVKQARKGWQGLVRRIRSSRQALSKRAQEFTWVFFMAVFDEVVREVAKEAKPRYCQDLSEETRKKWPRVLVVDASKLDPIGKRLKILRKVKDQVPGENEQSIPLIWGDLGTERSVDTHTGIESARNSGSDRIIHSVSRGCSGLARCLSRSCLSRAAWACDWARPAANTSTVNSEASRESSRRKMPMDFMLHNPPCADENAQHPIGTGGFFF